MPLTVKLETITPKKAAEYLAKNVAHNRKPRLAHIDKLARDITNGNWHQTGAPIAFNGDGTLYDGQHRLLAVIQAQKPIQTLVVRGIDHDAFAHIDTGSARTYNDVLRSRGEKTVTALSSGVRRVLLWARDDLGRSLSASVADLDALFIPHADAFRRAAGLYSHFGPALSGAPICAPPSIVVGVNAAGIIGGVEVDALEGFWRHVARGDKHGDITWNLRERYMSFAAQKMRNPTVLHAITVKAWNLYATGDNVRLLTWKPSIGEPFPHMLDTDGNRIALPTVA